MKILVLTPVYVTPQVDGIKLDTRAVHDLLAPLSEDNDIEVLFLYQHPFHDVRRYCSRKWRKRRRDGFEYCVDGIHVRLLEILKFPKQYSVELTKRQSMVVSAAIDELLTKGFCPDVVVAHMPTLFASAMDSPLLEGITRVGILHAADRLYAESKGFCKEKFTSFDAIFARNAALSSFFAEIGCTAIKEGVAYSGIEVESYSSAIKRMGSRKYAAMYAGKLISRKNVDLVIKAFSLVHKHDSAKLLIAGDGVEKESLQKLAMENLGRERCRFVGSVSRDDVLKLMSQSDVFVMPSVNETLGLVYLEAMSQGCIPVGTLGEGIDGTIVNGKNGFLVNPNLNSLTETMFRIEAMPAASALKMSSQAIETVRKLSREAASKNYINLLASQRMCK